MTRQRRSRLAAVASLLLAAALTAAADSTYPGWGSTLALGRDGPREGEGGGGEDPPSATSHPDPGTGSARSGRHLLVRDLGDDGAGGGGKGGASLGSASSSRSPGGGQRLFGIVHPETGHSRLQLDEEGLRFLEGLTGPVAPVVVIGPYRSGKSFLLNQLMNVSCDRGFGVGHTRATETKGVWVWAEAMRVTTEAGSDAAGEGGGGGGAAGGREGASGGSGSGSTSSGSAPEELSAIFVDTEGFESTGKADVYDDRIFALSALMSSVLIYNLPEAIRESDLERLSFAVELARAFYGAENGDGTEPVDRPASRLAAEDASLPGRGGGGGGGGGGAAGALRAAGSSPSPGALGDPDPLAEPSGGGGEAEGGRARWGEAVALSARGGAASPPPPALSAEPAVRPGSMVWVIQRDFLRGSDPQGALKQALEAVPNPAKDAGIEQLNRIRAGLGRLAARSTAVGLPQPHLNRTSLCELPDGELSLSYREGRERVRRAVLGSLAPKVVAGRALDGPGLAALIRRVVAALNERDIPTAGSLVAYFNADLVRSCREGFAGAAEARALPEAASSLEAALREAGREALRRLASDRFGTDDGALEEGLRALLRRDARARRDANEAASARACGRALAECEAGLERQAAARLPSRARFRARHSECRARFDAACVGPARDDHVARLDHARQREETRFLEDYNMRLLSGLSGLCLAGAVLSRFILRSRLAELTSWLGLAFFQLYPATFVASRSSMFDTEWWLWVAWAWEAAVFVPALDANLTWISASALLILALTRRLWAPLLRARLRRLPLVGRRVRRRRTIGERDLDV